MAAQVYANLAQSTLASNYTVGDTTLALTSGAPFPSTGDFMVAIDDPPSFFLKCTARSSNTLTIVAAAQEGTTRANTSSGVKVTQVITAGALDAVRSDSSQVGTFANLPVSGMKAGDRYACTDSPYTAVYDGSAWRYFVPGNPEMTLPPTGSWTWHNQSSTTVATTDGGLYFGYNTAAIGGFSSYVRTTPATPYAVKVFVRHGGDAVHWCWRNSSSGKLAIFRMGTISSVVQYNFSEYNTETSYQADLLSWTNFPLRGNQFWLHISDNSTNRSIGVSINGTDIIPLFSRSNTEWITPDQFGPCLANNPLHILSFA